MIDAAVCAYCQTEMDRVTAARCPDCDAVHHQDCWQDNGGCAVLGCAAGPDVTIPLQAASAAQVDMTTSAVGLQSSPTQPFFPNASLASGGGHMNYCTRCGQEVAGGAVFCTHCGELVAAGSRTPEVAAAPMYPNPLGPAWHIPTPASHEVIAKPAAKWSNRTIGIAAGTVVLLAVAAFIVFGTGGEKHTVTGDMSLSAVSSGLTTGSSCQGTNGYSDVVPGAQVTIENDSGTTLATSVYGDGVFDGTSCVFDFTFNDVPKSAFYRVLSGSNRGVLQFSYQQMVDNNWSVHLTLGSS